MTQFVSRCQRVGDADCPFRYCLAVIGNDFSWTDRYLTDHFLISYKLVREKQMLLNLTDPSMSGYRIQATRFTANEGSLMLVISPPGTSAHEDFFLRAGCVAGFLLGAIFLTDLSSSVPF